FGRHHTLHAFPTRRSSDLGARLEGRAAIAEQAASYMRALPDGRLVIRSVVETSEGAVVEWTLSGTHTGDLPGLPANGEQVALDRSEEHTSELQSRFELVCR